MSCSRPCAGRPSAEFPIDEAVYQRAGRDPCEPILCAGSLDAPFCSVGRDLGADEVLAGEPQIGAAGRQVRSGLYQAATGQEPPRSDRRLEPALALALLTNTVPYKPPGNKAYPDRVRRGSVLFSPSSSCSTGREAGS